MNNWIKSLVPLGLAGVLLAIVAIGFGSSAIQAAKPGTDSSDAMACNGEINTTGSVSTGSSTMHEVMFCSDPTDLFLVNVSWNGRIDSDKDLALIVTDPTGVEFVIDRKNTTSESFWAGPDLAEGVWTVEVVNMGSRNVRYDIIMGFA
jgi:hypothetical protein